MTPIRDRCGGSGRIYWTDDSYASYNEPCGGCEDCKRKENVVETHGRQEPIVTVSIPITVGGYTGQRDAWESHTQQYAVTVDGANVVLQNNTDVQRKITIPRHALEASIRMLAQQKPVLR